MLVSFEKNFLYVHVPKTGGTSMRAALHRYAHQPQACVANRCLALLGISVNHVVGGYRNYRFRTHERLDVVSKRLPRDVMSRMFKFAFVRNPWDLLPSLYRFILKTKGHKRHRVVADMSFADFIEFAAAKNIANQKRLVSDNDGNLLLDFVGRFEQLEKDCSVISDRLGIEIRLPHLNRTEQTSLASYYDAKSIRRLQATFRDDIDTFGYPPLPDFLVSSRS